MSAKYEKLKTLLRELFQLDQPDLDFGIYRIMHARSSEIGKFLDEDLLPQVSASFAAYQPADKVAIKAELDKAISQAQALGADPETLPKVKELQAKLANEAVDIASLEGEVYDHLYSFFRRYYSEGDFISKRVYKEGVYAIPYEGEEVKLHWANSDQYYIKTSEYLRDYAFRLQPDHPTDQMRVHFRLVDAKEGEHGNIKEAESKARLFILAAGDFISEENGELVVKFEYRPATLQDWPEAERSNKAKPPSQKELLALAEKRILGVTGTGFSRWMDLLVSKHRLASGEQVDYTRLAAHLNRYTARNTFDYFIHKDLGGFLKRELDFYIKNEVMHLDDVENESAPRVEQYLSKIKVIRKIAGKIIDFLAQLEDFQKKLWLKKKFVVDTNYCITLDRIPEAFYPEIAVNDAQREEWVRLFAIDDIKGEAGDLVAPKKTGYSVPLSIDFLKSNDKLIVDTKFFSKDFTYKIIASIENMSIETNGILINSENFQALSLLNRRYRNQIGCVYIDPPYNAPKSEIAYKNNYKHSSFLTLINDRLILSSGLVGDDGSHVIAIDKNEENGVDRLVSQTFPNNDNVTITIEHNRKGVQDSHFSFTHEYAIFSIGYKKNELNQVERPKEDWEYSNLRNWGGESLRTDAANCFYPITIKNNEIIGFGEVWSDLTRHPESANISRSDGLIDVFPIDKQGVERKWRYERGTIEGIVSRLKVERGGDGIIQVFIAKTSDQFKTVWYGSRYNAGDNGTRLANEMGLPIGEFDYPKSIFNTKDCIFSVTNDRSIILDYFAGSGTTGQAVITLNREDSGKRSFILVEMGAYFNSVLKARILKTTYSSIWKNAKPVSRNTGLSCMIKYIHLESYEDTLNNLELKRTTEQQSLLDLAESKGPDKLKEDYTLRYLIDIESRGSPSLLSIDRFVDPTAYKLKVKKPGSDESSEVNVDLIETFNYLIGLKVNHISEPHVLTADFVRDGENRLNIARGSLKLRADGKWWFRNVTGSLLDGRRVLVIWRKRPGGETSDGLEQDNLVLDEWFKSKQGYSTKDSEFDIIYVNGTNNLENLKTQDDLWKVRLIEEDFLRLMVEDGDK